MLLVNDRTKYVMIDVIFGALITLTLNILLIPPYGIVGAAIATSSAVVLSACFDAIFAWRFTKMNPFGFKAMFKCVLAGAISISVVMLIYKYVGMSASMVTLIPLFVLFLLVYGSLLVVFRALDKNDVFILKELEKKLGIRVGFIRGIVKIFIR
jgi:O-antigen/teichoic acid export membrane protein